MRPSLHICLLCTEKWGQIAGPGLLLLFTDFSLRRQRPGDPSLSRPNIRLALSLPAQKVSSQTASGGGLRWRHATPGRACGRGRSRRVSSHPRFGSAVRRYRQAEGAEVDERKINLHEEGNENNTLAMAGNLKNH